MSFLEARLRRQAAILGFDLVGIAPAVTPPGYSSFRAWLEHGFAGEMTYLERHAAAREHPRSILPDVRSVVMAAVAYPRREPPSETGGPHPPRGRVSCYAMGQDYHVVLRERLKSLLAWLQEEEPRCRGRVVVDTAPLLERDYGRLAGLGWIAKNTMLIHPRLGSFFFLGAILVNIPLEPDRPFDAFHCGRCTACLDACPTQAFVGPGLLDARRCISYLTIEHRGPIEPELRPQVGDWVFGCDICQDVCPWNRKAPAGRETAFPASGGEAALPLDELLRLSPEETRDRFRRRAMSRAGRTGLRRNAAIALGNSGDRRSIPDLALAAGDDDPIVRGAAAWALGRLGSEAARKVLEDRLAIEADPQVRRELERALDEAVRQAGH